MISSYIRNFELFKKIISEKSKYTLLWSHLYIRNFKLFKKIFSEEANTHCYDLILYQKFLNFSRNIFRRNKYPLLWSHLIWEILKISRKYFQMQIPTAMIWSYMRNFELFKQKQLPHCYDVILYVFFWRKPNPNCVHTTSNIFTDLKQTQKQKKKKMKVRRKQ